MGLLHIICIADTETVKDLITEKNVDAFPFGSKSAFDEFCLAVVTELKNKYPRFRRVYVRTKFSYVDESYTTYLLQSYNHTYYPERMINAGKAAYVERNYEMIDNSSYCIIYYDENYMPPRQRNSKRDVSDCQPSSGTKRAYDHAIKKNTAANNLL